MEEAAHIREHQNPWSNTGIWGWHESPDPAFSDKTPKVSKVWSFEWDVPHSLSIWILGSQLVVLFRFGRLGVCGLVEGCVSLEEGFEVLKATHHSQFIPSSFSLKFQIWALHLLLQLLFLPAGAWSHSTGDGLIPLEPWIQINQPFHKLPHSCVLQQQLKKWLIHRVF